MEAGAVQVSHALCDVRAFDFQVNNGHVLLSPPHNSSFTAQWASLKAKWTLYRIERHACALSSAEERPAAHSVVQNTQRDAKTIKTLIIELCSEIVETSQVTPPGDE